MRLRAVSCLARPSIRLLAQYLIDAPYSSVASLTGVRHGDLNPVKGRFDLRDKSYIVTRGGRGIVYAITRATAEMGGNLSVLDAAPVPMTDVTTLAAKFGVRTKYMHADITDKKSLAQAFDDTVTEFSSLGGWYVLMGCLVRLALRTHRKSTVTASELPLMARRRATRSAGIVKSATLEAATCPPRYFNDSPLNGIQRKDAR
ncbi:uncharacterized protein BP5553_09773 [Venustampulla echinocandica]|uniref:Uncharacterized protein n=1 Tax=Venustampulla echinocandica TaxID=2656787 RepID=A0A370TAL6_9HELO|nr:uncharacterized protein BP5553_09773 [Venustampulla echinocandica]RDL30984.1 hypothetical protein BP5553_09773 [Venustampulla echinocandica]